MDIRDGQLDALQFIAEGVTALSEFALAAVSLVEGDDLRTVAVAGSAEAAAELLDMRAPVGLVLAELAVADQWGRLLFVPHDRAPGGLDGYEWVPQVERATGPDAWHAEDLLCAPLRDEDGQLRGLISFDLPRNGKRPDATQQQVLNVHAAQAELAVVSLVERDEFARDLEVARRFSRYRGQLIDKLAHEVRNPATSILMHAELAQEEPSDLERDKHLAAITRGAHRISDMAESLLLMASVDNADARPTGEVDLVAVVRDVRGQVADDATRDDIDVALDLPDRPVVVPGDVHELCEAVRNLVSNAVKYSRPGGVVRVGVEVRADHVVLCVVDEGIGISTEDQSRLFEEFYRASSPEVRSKPGHGLGLAIVDRVVRRHGGHVDVESTLGSGTTMSVTLPRRGADSSRSAAA